MRPQNKNNKKFNEKRKSFSYSDSNNSKWQYSAKLSENNSEYNVVFKINCKEAYYNLQNNV